MEDNNEMNDINYIIQLEAYKRFKEEENHIRPLVEEKIKQYNEVRNEYLNLYSKFVDLIKLSACRNALQTENMEALQSDSQTGKSISVIARETNIDKQEEFFNVDDISLTKELIAKAPQLEHLVDLNYSSENNKNRVDFIQTSLIRVERKLESSIVTGFDSLLKRIEN